MRIPGYVPTEPDEKVVSIHTSYDTSMRLWIVTAHNAAGSQIGDAQFPAGKKWMTEEARAMAERHGLPRTAIKRIDQ